MTHQDVLTLKQAEENLQGWFAEFHSKSLEILERVKESDGYTDEELCDIGFFCREIERITDEWRKDVKAAKELIGKVLCARRVKATANDEAPDMTVRAEFSTGSPDVRLTTTFPKRGTTEYEQLLSSMGVKQDIIENGVLVPHWTHMTEHVTALVEAGGNPPPGVQLRAPIYSTTFRRKNQ